MRRLLKAATYHVARKYIATAHQALAEVAVERGRLAEAETELAAALDLLHTYLVPVVAWKVYAALGRLRLRTGTGQAARECFARAAEIVSQIAAGVGDEDLRATFLSSPAVREVLAGSAG